jgi:hypothetical protein
MEPMASFALAIFAVAIFLAAKAKSIVGTRDVPAVSTFRSAKSHMCDAIRSAPQGQVDYLTCVWETRRRK